MRPRFELKQTVTKPLMKIWKIIRSLFCFVIGGVFHENGKIVTDMDLLHYGYGYEGPTRVDAGKNIESRGKNEPVLYEDRSIYTTKYIDTKDI